MLQTLLSSAVSVATLASYGSRLSTYHKNYPALRKKCYQYAPWPLLHPVETLILDYKNDGIEVFFLSLAGSLLLSFQSLSVSPLPFSHSRAIVYWWSCGTRKCPILRGSWLCSDSPVHSGVAQVAKSFSCRLDWEFCSPSSHQREEDCPVLVAFYPRLSHWGIFLPIWLY